jgi:hypothetical protein
MCGLILNLNFSLDELTIAFLSTMNHQANPVVIVICPNLLLSHMDGHFLNLNPGHAR